MLENFTPDQIAFFIILVVALGLLLTERLRNDIVAILIILSLYLTGVLEAEEALAGFSSEPAIIVAAIFVLSAGLHQTGLSEIAGAWIGRLAGSSLRRALAVIMPSVALLSAFTHHLTTTAVMLPITLTLSREKDIPASKLLMPLSFAASLGTTITIIGAPAFLIADEILREGGAPGLGIFSIAPIGLAISTVGTIFMLLVGRFLLPSRSGGSDAAARFRLDDYFTELTILPDSPFLNQTVGAVEANDRYNFRVAGWLRNGRPVKRPFGDQQLRMGDVLLVRASPEDIIAIRQEPGVELHPIAKYGVHGDNGHDGDVEELLAQAVVGPNSDLINRTIGRIDFRARYGAIVVGLWRRQGWLNQELSKIKLCGGDVLVLQGDQESLNRVTNDRAFLMLVPFHGELRLRRKATLAGLIMLGTIIAAAFNLMSIEMAAMAGALAMVLTRCLTSRQAYRAIDQRIYVFIAGAIPLGLAMQKSGTSELIASWLRGAVGSWPEVLILIVLFAIVAVLTQFMSDAGTTAIFAPVALALAQALGQRPEPYVVTVAMAAVASFLTPIGHHGNLLVYGPGRYQFADFVRVGTPLTIIVAVVVCLLSPIVWPG